jgi:hypothetical protein
MEDISLVWFNISVLILGICSVSLMMYSRSKLTKGLVYSLYTRVFIVTSLLLCSSILHIFRFFFNWDAVIGDRAQYPEYAFIVVAYIFLLYTSLKMTEIGKKFGFKK